MTNNYCKECGAVLKPDEKFCTDCGAKVSDTPQPNVHVNMQQPVNDIRNRAISTIEWIGIFLITMIPIINVVVLIVWAMSATCRLSLRNYARAMLIVMIVSFILGIITGIAFAGIIRFIFQEITDYSGVPNFDFDDIFSQTKKSLYSDFFVWNVRSSNK